MRVVLILVAAPLAGYAVAGPVGTLVALAIGLLGPRQLRLHRERQARERLEAGLPSSVSGLSAALRAGLSLSQAIAFAAREAGDPLGSSLRRIADREALGEPLDRSIERWADDAGSDDVNLVSTVLKLRIGGGLPGVLDQLARTLRQREAARREVQSLTAQARLSGVVLALLPVGFFLFLSLTSRHDVATAYGSPIGVVAIVGGLVLDAVGYLWIRRLLRIAT